MGVAILDFWEFCSPFQISLKLKIIISPKNTSKSSQLEKKQTDFQGRNTKSISRKA